LALQTASLFGTQFAFIRLEALPNIADLLIEIFELGLARRELPLQFGRTLLAFRGGDNGLANIQYAHLGGDCSPCCRGRLRAESCNADQARRCQRGRTQHLIHSSLLVSGSAARFPFNANRNWLKFVLPAPQREIAGPVQTKKY